MIALAILYVLLSSLSNWGEDFREISTRATAARLANNTPQAIELYRQALKLNPAWQEGWWFLGTLLYDGDQYAGGNLAFQHLVDLDPQAAPGWAFLGLCEFETGDYDKALSHIQRAMTLGADKEKQLAPVLTYHLALLQTKTSYFDVALQTYAAIVHSMRDAMPNQPMLLSIGLAALRLPKVPKEIEPLKKELYLSAGKTAYFVLAGDYAAADAAFADLLQHYPGTANVHYMHGLYLMARDPDAAFQEFRLELNLVPDNTAAQAMLAFGLLTRGDADEALPYAQKAAQSNDNSPFFKYVFGRALVETGDLQRGLPYLEAAEKADPGNAEVHVSLAAAYSRTGRPAQARHERELAMQMESRNQAVGQL
jgi:tetratricopeptide (TPR) repeat protein